MSLSASTDKDTALKAGFSFKTNVSPDDSKHLELAPELEIASDKGISNLFSFDGATTLGNKKWNVGLNATLQMWVSKSESLYGDAEAIPIKRLANAACRELCKETPVPDDAKTYCATTNNGDEAYLARLDMGAFCDKGKKWLQDNADAAPIPEAVPNWHISLGGSFGQQVFERRQDVGGELVELKSDRLLGKVGFSLAHLSQRPKGGATTFELGVRYSSDWTGATETVKWCEPTAPVQLDSGDSTQRAVPGQTCGESPLGAPTFAGKLFATLRLGYMDLHAVKGEPGKTASLWRVAPGLFFDGKFNAKTEFKAGFQLPVYFNATTQDGFDAKGYLGAIRVTLAICAVRATDATFSPGVFLTVDVLGDRYILHRGLDW